MAKGSLDVVNFEETKKMLQDRYSKNNIDSSEMDVTEQHGDDGETSCGYWMCRDNRYLKKFANKNCYVGLFGALGCLFSASYAYFNGTISTVEKRFGIPSRVMGIITTGNDVSQLLISVFLTYYASRKHQPRWIGFGCYTVVLFCLISALPHFIYGPGEDALSLTKEFTNGTMASLPSVVTFNYSAKAVGAEERRNLCEKGGRKCNATNDDVVAPLILFLAQFVSGVGASLYHSLGVSYMDDNVKRSKTPLFFSYAYFIRGLGPVLGYVISSVCLKMYIAPTLTPTISTNDPRWLGAWWLGWLVIGCLILIFSTVITLFPKTLPRTVARRSVANQKETLEKHPNKASFNDMVDTFARLFSNKTLMCNNVASVFYLLGIMPLHVFLPKYIEVIYVQSASFANLVTGMASLAFTALGIFSSGVVLSKYKPRARCLAAWNVFVGAIMVTGVISFAFLECPDVSESTSLNFSSRLTKAQAECNKDCNCDYVKYSPVCALDGKTNFISPCHAGCKDILQSKVYGNCSCVGELYGKNRDDQGLSIESKSFGNHPNNNSKWPADSVTAGACPVNCYTPFLLFLCSLCFLNFLGATGKITNFLVGVRCVEEKDKSVAMSLGLTMMSLLGFIPSPILFGYIIDRNCLVWGKTCSGKGHCWIYNSKTLRHSVNFTSAFFVAMGVLFDAGVWYLVKDTQIFDEDVSKLNNDQTKEVEKIALPLT